LLLKDDKAWVYLKLIELFEQTNNVRQTNGVPLDPNLFDKFESTMIDQRDASIRELPSTK